MDSETERSFDDLIKKSSLKKPPLDLTDKIMQRIDDEAAMAMELEPGLKKLIRLQTLKTPPARLTRNIATELFPASRNPAPVISPRIWYAALICTIILMIGGSYIFPPGNSSSQYELHKGAELLYKLPNLTSFVSIEYLAGLVVIFTLLAIDFLLRYRQPKIV